MIPAGICAATPGSARRANRTTRTPNGLARVESLPLLQDMPSDRGLPCRAEKHRSGIFNYGWLEQRMAAIRATREDVQATLAESTAVTISQQVLLSGGCERLLVCGGGT